MTASRLTVPLNDLHALKIVVREQGAPIPIELHGEWDLADGPAVRQAIELSERPAAHNTRLVIIPRPVQRMFEITGLLEMLPFVEEPPRTGDDRPHAALTAAPASSVPTA